MRCPTTRSWRRPTAAPVSRSRARTELEDALSAAFTAGRSAVVDVRCDPEEKVFPMVPAGAAAVDILEAPDGEVRHGMSAHTISVRLENKPGALARVSQLFSRRGYNIQSLAVGPTERSDISRLTLRVDCSEHSLEQIEKQMHKLVNVLRVTELRPGRGRRARARPVHRQRLHRQARRARRAQPGRGRAGRRHRPRRDHLRVRRSSGRGRGVRRTGPPVRCA